MNILKPRKSRFDEDLASRVNKEVKKKTASPGKRIVIPTSDELVDFCGTQIYKKELEALREVYTMFKGKPEDDYSPDKDGRIRIEEGHLNCVSLSWRGLSSLPESVGNWTELQNIDLYSNELSSLPESVGNWTKLQEIYLWNNKLTSLPESVGNWKNLIWIYLYRNQLTSLPESVGNWKNLKVIYLRDNQLTSLPESVENWKNLQKIGLDIADKKHFSELRRRFPKATIYTR